MIGKLAMCNLCCAQNLKSVRLKDFRVLAARGFTLIELVVVIAIIGILAAIAAPSFNDTILGNELRATANKLVSSAYLARGEAIKRNRVITLCASSNGTSCTGSWEQGWVVLNGTTLLSKEGAIRTGFKVTEGGGLTSLSFQPTGLGSTQAILTACRATPSVGNQARVVTISTTGRASAKKTTASSCA